MSTPNTIRAALQRLLQVVKPKYNQTDEIIAVVQAIAAARAALAAEPVGEGPSDQELLDLADDSDLDRFEGERSYPDGTVIKEGCWEAWDHQLLAFARAALDRWARPAAPPPLPLDYIDPEHQRDDRDLLETFYVACNAEGGTADEIHLRGIRAVLAARLAAPPAPEVPSEALAARPLLEKVARLANHGGGASPSLLGKITALSGLAAAWLRDNPPGQPVAIEPRGCPTPGACSCVEPVTAAPAAPEVGEVVELVARLRDWHSIPPLQERERIATLLLQLAAPAPAVVPVAVEALTRLYWWGGMQEGGGYDSNVVLGVRHWIDGGMVGGLPQLPRWIADRCPPLPQGGEGES